MVIAKDLILVTEGESVTLVYADATKGWLVVNDSNNDAGGPSSIYNSYRWNNLATVVYKF